MIDKTQFIQHKWQPFLNKLDAIYEGAKRRTELGYDLAHRLPAQPIISSLAKECHALTSEYYGEGKGNLSVMYQFLIKISIVAGVTFYDPIQVSMSQDGYLGLHDLDTQLSLGKAYLTNVRGEYIKHGGRIVRGRSAIDNTIYPNVFLREEGLRLIARQGVMKAVVKFLRKLKNNPRDIENAGQLSQAAKEFLWQEICVALPPQTHSNEATEFVDFLHKNPDEYIENDRSKHRALLFASLANGELKAVPPATMVRITPHRFIKLCYTRHVPLQTIQDGQYVTLREVGAKEVVYLRPNEGHYLHDYHGMSLASGHLIRAGNLFFPSDPAAFNRTNRYPDIEWMVLEALAYNSSGELPEEKAVMVGRNSYTGSSIKQTAHGQAVCATLEKFPHYAAINNPCTISGVDATLDFIQFGTQPDSSGIKIITKNLRDNAFLKLVSDLILAMQMKFGIDNIDFQIQIIPTADRFALIFIPFAMLQQNGNIFTNPTTGATNVAMNIPEHLHMGNASGRWAATPEQRKVWNLAGQQYLQKLYDYAALSGTHEFMQNFMQDLLIVKPALRMSL